MKLAIILPTLPAYRKDFFNRLDVELKKIDCEMNVLHGTQFLNKEIKTDANPQYRAFPIKTSEFALAGYRMVWWTGIIRKLHRLKPDAVIILFSPGNMKLWLLQLYCYLFRIRVGIWSCGFTRDEVKGFKRKMRAAILNFFLFKADFHVCYGTAYRDTLLGLGIDNSKIFVAQNTLNVENILSIDLSERENRKSETVNFLFVGALISEKNLDLAILAFKRLVADGYNATLSIVGQGLIIDELRAIVKSEGVESHVFVTGPRYGAELTNSFIGADVFIMPGTGGLAINEAMAYGLPILSTTGDSTVTDLLIEGENGYFLDDRASVENIYDKCRQIITGEKDRLLSMGRRSRQIVSERATLGNMVEKYRNAVIYGLNHGK
jgi:glycosyltransferase involved in cell wall biosynthesis